MRACQTVATATTTLTWSCRTRMTTSMNSPVTSASHTSPRGLNSSTTMTRSVPTEAQQNIPSFGELSYQEGGSELPDAMTGRTRPASQYAEPKTAPPYVRIQNVEETTPGNPAHSPSGLANHVAKLERSLGLNQGNQNVGSTSGSSMAESNPQRPGLCRICRNPDTGEVPVLKNTLGPVSTVEHLDIGKGSVRSLGATSSTTIRGLTWKLLVQACRRLWLYRVNSAASGTRDSAADHVRRSIELEIILNTDCQGSLYLNMEANGIPIMALVDSGSTISMIHPAVLDRIQWEHDVTLVGHMGKLLGADGRTVETHGVVQLSLRVGTDPTPVLHEMVVAEMDVPAIMGTDFMMLNHCILDATRGTLIFNGRTISVIHPSVLDRIQRGHDVTLVGDMGQLRVADGRTGETHGVVQLSLRVGKDPTPELHEMVVAEMDAPAIMGIDFMMLNHCMLDATSGTFIFNDRTHHCRVVQRCSKRHMPAFYVATSYILAIHTKHVVMGMLWWDDNPGQISF